MKYLELIKEGMKKLECEFKKDELAYLALTSKVERQVRDKFAWYLYKKLEKSKKKCCFVIREYGIKDKRKKIDFAILNKEGKPKVFIEFKAMSVLSHLGNKDSRTKMEEDIAKMKKAKNGKTELYFIQLVNLPDGIAENYSEPHYKYHIQPSQLKGIKEYLDKYGNAREVLKKVKEKWEEGLKGKGNKFYCSTIEAGKFYDNSLDIVYWIIWPKNQK